jgi:hypothetical protein
MSRECGEHGTEEIFVQYCGQQSLRNKNTLEAWKKWEDNINVDPKEIEYEKVDFFMWFIIGTSDWFLLTSQ